MRKPPDYNTLNIGCILSFIKNHLHSRGHWGFRSTMPNKRHNKMVCTQINC